MRVNRITGRWDVPEHSAPRWEYHALPEDLGLVEMFTEDDEVEEVHEGESEFMFTMSVRFPRSDYPAILARMVRHNEVIAQVGSGDRQVKCLPEGRERDQGLTVAPPAAAADAACPAPE